MALRMPGEGRVEVSLDRSTILLAAMYGAPHEHAPVQQAPTYCEYPASGRSCKGHQSTAA
jgi:hypothetical protein